MGESKEKLPLTPSVFHQFCWKQTSIQLSVTSKTRQ